MHGARRARCAFAVRDKASRHADDAAADLIADPQVLNRGTIGGSLANADPAADWPAVAIAVNAELELAGPAGRRHVAAKDFFVDIMTTALEPNEVLVAIDIPRPNPRA